MPHERNLQRQRLSPPNPDLSLCFSTDGPSAPYHQIRGTAARFRYYKYLEEFRATSTPRLTFKLDIGFINHSDIMPTNVCRERRFSCIPTARDNDEDNC